MKEKLFISAAGIGSRVAGLSAVPNKSLLPINYETIISKIINKFDKKIEIVIALGHYGNLVEEFLKLAHPERKIIFVKIDRYTGEGTGPGYTLMKCRKYLQCPFIYSACDTLTVENPKFEKYNWLGVSKTKISERFLVIEKKPKDLGYIFYNKKRSFEIKKSKKSFNAFIGLANIFDYKLFWKGFDENKKIEDNELQFSNGLYFLSKKIKLKNFKWLDTGTNESYLKTLGHFKDKTQRKPDELIYIIGKRVIKYFVDKKKCKNLKKRIPALGTFAPKIIKSSNNFLAYEYIEGRHLTEVSIKNFNNFLNDLNNRFWIKPKINKKIFYKKCRLFYEKKTYERIYQILKINPDIDNIGIINNFKIPSVFKLMSKINWSYLSKGIPVNFHGDLQPENILLSKENNFKFIDWRTDFSGLSYGDIYYEFAKLNHMLTINTRKVLQGKIKLIYKSKNHVTYSYETRKILLNFQKNLFQFLKKKQYDSKKVKILTALVYLNIAKFYNYPYNELLFFHGKYNLYFETK